MSPGGLRSILTTALSALVVLIPVGWILNLPRAFGVALYTEQVLAATLGAAMALLFLKVRAGKHAGEGVPWYDYVAALLGALACGYVAVRYPVLVNEIVYRPWDGILVAVVLVLLTVEGVRRTAGMALTSIVLIFIAYGLLGHLVPGGFASRQIDPSRLAVYLGLDTNALFGTPLQVAVIVIVPFILLGQILARSGGADFFTDLAMSLMGRYRGGAGKISVVGSAFFGSISGSAVANVVGTGIITIPLMKRSGFPPQVAGAIEAVASTGGQLMPPVMGAAAFLMAEFLQISYGQVMVAALAPAILYYVALFIQVDLEAAKRGITAVPVDRIPATLATLRRGWHFLAPFAVFLGALFFFNIPPERAALMATAVLVVTSLVFGYGGRRPSLRDLWAAAISTGGTAVDILLITAGAGLVIGILNLSGLAFSLSLYLIALSGGSLPVLLVLAAGASIVLGMGMPTVGVYVLLATLVAPAMVEAGVLPIAAHMFVLYFGMLSMVTPPVALAAFAGANLAQADAWKTGWTAARFGWSAYIVPFLFVVSPSLLLIGDPLLLVWAFATAVVGVGLVSVGLAGFLFGRIGLGARILYVVAGLLVLTPVGTYPGSLYGELGGLAVAAVLIGRDYLARRQVHAPRHSS